MLLGVQYINIILMYKLDAINTLNLNTLTHVKLVIALYLYKKEMCSELNKAALKFKQQYLLIIPYNAISFALSSHLNFFLEWLNIMTIK